MFNQHCQDNGIQRQLTMAGTPQQNGVCRTPQPYLLEIANCLTAKHDLHQRIWAETISIATYLQNRLSSKATPHSIPEELYFVYKLDISHLCVFGSTEFVHIPSNKRD